MFFLQQKSILGQNARNLFIQKQDQREFFGFADSKIKTKLFYLENNIPVPKMLAVIRNQEILQKFDFSTLYPPFVIKPDSGAKGKGILIINDRQGEVYIDSDRNTYTIQDLQRYCRYIIGGRFSLQGGRDRVLIEEKIVLDPQVALFGKYGLPDIRVIVYKGVPLMTMIRIPTESSHGKANIYQGACGAGVDIGNGMIFSIIQKNISVRSVPGIGDIRGVIVPHWDEVLEIAAKVQQTSGLNFVACDIVLDANRGPLLLEINARAGLSVQNANQAGLLSRIERLEGVKVDSVEKGIRLAKDLFGKHTSDTIRHIQGRPIVGTYEYIHFEGSQRRHRFIAGLNPTTRISVISQGLYKKLLDFGCSVRDISDLSEKKVEISCLFLGKEYFLECIVRSKGDPVFLALKTSRSIVLGGDFLRSFFLDPNKYGEGVPPKDILEKKSVNTGIIANQIKQIEHIDTTLIHTDKRLQILSSLYPLNYMEEKEKFIASRGEYIPSFTYKKVRLDFDAIQKKLEKLEIPDIPLGNIYTQKREEIFTKLELLRYFQLGNDKKISVLSKKLYGGFEEGYIEEAKEKTIQAHAAVFSQEVYLTQEEIVQYILKFNVIYDIHLKIVFAGKDKLTSRCSIGKKTLHIRNDIQVSKKELRAIVAHEIEGHYLRKMNGLHQKLLIFSTGTAGYLSTEEGIAIYNQSRFLNDTMTKSYKMYQLYYLMYFTKNYSYRELRSYMEELFNGNWAKVFDICVRIKRGMHDFTDQNIFYKDTIYLNGYKQVSEYINLGGSLQELYLGKIGIHDIDILKESNVFLEKKDLKYPLFVS